MRRASGAGLVLGILFALVPARPALLGAQAVVPGADRSRVTADVRPDHWALDALRRAEGLGLLGRPLPLRGAISADEVEAALREAAERAERRPAGVAALARGWYIRFLREFGGLAGPAERGEVQVLSARISAEGAWGTELVAPGLGEFGPGRTGALPLEDEGWGGVAVDVSGALGRHVGFQLEPELTTEGIDLRRGDVAAGWGNWKFSLGRQPLRQARSVAAGLTLSGSAPLDRFEVRTERPEALPGALGVLGPVSLQLFVSHLRDDDRHAREPFLWGGSFSLQPHPRLGLAVHRAVLFGGRGYDEPVTAKTLVDMLIGRVANLGFENQIVSVEARYRLPTEPWVPLTAYLEWGAEDAAGGWWDVPGRVVGLETAAIPGLEPVSLGTAYTHMAEQCCGNSPWYRHWAFHGSWAADDRPLGHPLGGQGWEWRAYGSYDRPERGYRIDGSFVHREREGQNLYVPGRRRSDGVRVRGSWRERPGVELVGELRLESGADWTEQRFGLAANLFF